MEAGGDVEMEEVVHFRDEDNDEGGGMSDDDLSDNEIILPGVRMTRNHSKKDQPLSVLVRENRERAGIVQRPLYIAVHNLSFSLEVTKARSATRTIWHDFRERWKVEKKEKVTKRVLDNVSFFVREKMMVLILGPPGCGKTSIMKLLANDMPYGRVHGEMFFNKEHIDPDSHHQMVSYVTQEDCHVPFLTVRETLEFAGHCLLDKHGKLMKDVDVADIADMVMQLLGLYHRADTVVGNDMVRGVSGGEKRRVSIGIELMKRPKFLLLDEATTGLDTTRSIEFGKFCRVIADAFVPVIGALLQPPYKLYKKFDHILLMHEGRVAYFGKRKEVLKYFEGIGFQCPSWMNPADFLVSILIRPDEFRIEGAPRVVETGNDFAIVYAQSSMYNDVILPRIRESFPDDVDPEEEPPTRGFSSLHEHPPPAQPATEEEGSHSSEWNEGEHSPVFTSSRSPNLTLNSAMEFDGPPPEKPEKFYTTKFEQFILLTKRGFRCTKNFPAMNIFLMFYSLFLGLFYGTLFFQLGDNQVDVQLKSGVVFNIVMVIGLQANKSNDTLFQERPVFLYQRAKRYFSTFPYFLACLVNTLPGMAMNVCLFATVAYWMADLTSANHGGRFFFLLLIGILLQLCTDGWVRFIGQLNSSYITAQGISPFTIAGFILFAGFFRQVDDMPWAVRWIAYVDPFRWAYEASVINELGGQDFTCGDDQLVPPSNDPLLFLPFNLGGYEGNQACPITTGEYALTTLGLEDDQSWKWYCLLFLIILLVTFHSMYLIVLKYVKHEKPEMLRLKEWEIEGEGKWMMEVDKKIGNYSEESLKERREGKPRVIVEAINLCYSVEIVNDHHDDEEKHKEEEIEEEEDEGSGEEEPLQKSSRSDSEREYRKEGGFGDVGLWNKIKKCLPNTKNKLSSALPCGSGEKSWLMLLENVRMRAEPGMLVALMGPSGAGKSTLMDVIAGRKTGGKITGDILFNGKPRDKFFSRYTGYCEQQNLHVEWATVWEAVRLAAFTRLPASWPKEEKLANVKYAIERLRLESSAHILVKHLRLEQKKRLTVAVELVTNPSVMFLDEPTSGLDATEASEIIRVVKEEARKGMAMVCTIHQPSAQIFSLFSHVILLKKGGKMVFNGKVSDMAPYFEKEMGLKMPPRENPADFGLDVASIQDEANDPAEVWARYSEKRGIEEPSEKMAEDDSAENSLSEDSPVLEYDSKYPASFTTQCKELTVRSFRSIIRRPQDFRVRIARNLILGVLAGGVFYDAGDGQTGPNTRVSSFYFLLIVATFNSFTQIALIILDRPSFYRERLSGSYRAFAYLLALMLPDLPLQILSFLLYSMPQYFMIGLRIGVEEIFYYILTGVGTFILCFCLINLVAVVAFSAPVATLLGGVAITISNLLAGFFIPFDQIPDYWIWAYYISFVRYPLEGLTVSELTDQAFNCGEDGTERAVPVPVGDDVQYYCQITNGNQVIESYNMESSHQWPWMGVTYGYTFAFVLATLVALVKIIHLNR